MIVRAIGVDPGRFSGVADVEWEDGRWYCLSAHTISGDDCPRFVCYQIRVFPPDLIAIETPPLVHHNAVTHAALQRRVGRVQEAVAKYGSRVFFINAQTAKKAVGVGRGSKQDVLFAVNHLCRCEIVDPNQGDAVAIAIAGIKSYLEELRHGQPTRNSATAHHSPRLRGRAVRIRSDAPLPRSAHHRR